MKLVTALSFAAVFAFAGPAVAGNPQSTGLTLTEAVARQATTTVVVRHADAGCLQSAAQNVSGLPGLQRVAVRGGALQATFASSARAGEAEGEVRAAIASACAASGEAAAAAR